MGSFLSDLGKGFIRSAVNQVGRDTGKVISNNVYGDRHATPIRNVSYSTKDRAYLDDIENKIISNAELREMAINEGFKPVYFRMNGCFFVGIKIFLFFMCVIFVSASLSESYTFIATVPPLLLSVFGLEKIFSKKIEMVKSVNVMQYVQDRRYKSGARPVGYTKKDVKIEIEANNEQLKIKRLIGICYFIFAFLMYHFGYTLYCKMNDIA